MLVEGKECGLPLSLVERELENAIEIYECALDLETGTEIHECPLDHRTYVALESPVEDETR
jgi:hypothetical protein